MEQLNFEDIYPQEEEETFEPENPQVIEVDVLYNPHTGLVEGYGSSLGGENKIRLAFNEDDDFIANPFIYKVVDGVVVKDIDYQLESHKIIKEKELGDACNQSILEGFNYTFNNVEYHFSFDVEAQLNFQGAERILGVGLTDEITWTVSRDGEYERISINTSMMNELALAILKHKDENISKFRDVLMAKVKNAETIEEIEAITWDMEISKGESANG